MSKYFKPIMYGSFSTLFTMHFFRIKKDEKMWRDIKSIEDKLYRIERTLVANKTDIRSQLKYYNDIKEKKLVDKFSSSYTLLNKKSKARVRKYTSLKNL